MRTPRGGTPQTIVAGMGEMKVVRCAPGAPLLLKATLGSCVGLFLADSRNKVCGVAHIMLPEKLREDNAAGKYADTAPVELLRQISEAGDAGEIQAYLIGGACMFAAPQPSFVSDVGSRNVEAVRRVISLLNIPIVYEDTGGDCGRTAVFDCLDFTVSVRTLRKIGPRS